MSVYTTYRKARKLIFNPKAFLIDFIYKRHAVGLHNVIAVGIAPWKRDVFKKYIGENNVIFVSKKESAEDISIRVRRLKVESVYIWGASTLEGISFDGADIYRVEDGFVRSIGLGAERNIPFSLCFDKVNVHYCASKETDLENCLNNYKSNVDNENKSRILIRKIQDYRITKYNINNREPLIRDVLKKQVLVVGQVEDDESIRYCGSKIKTNAELVDIAINENPDAQIIYKPHPDVQKGKRATGSHIKAHNRLTILNDAECDLVDLFSLVECVYTISSLSGFEALLYDKTVVVFGAPFYSGWGLTDDRCVISRRKNKLTIEQLFYVAYVQYPKYISPVTKKPCHLENLIEFIIESKSTVGKTFRDVNESTLSTKIQTEKKEFVYTKISRIENIQELWKRKPWSAHAVKAYVNYYKDRSDYASAISIIQRYIDVHKGGNEFKLLLCQIIRSSGSYSPKIIPLLEEIIAEEGNSDWKVRYFLCQYVWETKGICKELIPHLNFLKNNLAVISPAARLFLSAAYIEAGRYHDALTIYNNVNDRAEDKVYFTLRALYNYKHLNDSSLFEKLKSILSIQNEFKKIILDNRDSFAVVGNAPSEIGSSNGKLIDESKIVIRFNSFSTDYIYQNDYGTKTDIWVKSGYYWDVKRKICSDLRMVIQSGNNPAYRNNSFSDFYLDCEVMNIPMTYIPPEIYYELIDKINHSPSAGLCIIYWIYKMIGPVNRAQIFGFSYGDQSENRAEHYFKSPSSGYYPHDWEKEAKLLSSITF